MKEIKFLGLGMFLGGIASLGTMVMLDKKTMNSLKYQVDKMLKSTANYVDELKKEI